MSELFKNGLKFPEASKLQKIPKFTNQDIFKIIEVSRITLEFARGLYNLRICQGSVSILLKTDRSHYGLFSLAVHV